MVATTLTYGSERFNLPRLMRRPGKIVQNEGTVSEKRESMQNLVDDLLARLSSIADEFSQRSAHLAASGAARAAQFPATEDLVETASRVIARRKLRTSYFPPAIFHEPAWEALLVLFVADARRETLNIKALASMLDAPLTTSQRWIEYLGSIGMISRTVDENDRRRIEVALTDKGRRALTDYLRALQQE